MISHQQFFTGLWIVVILAQTLLLVVLLARKAFRDYPAFSAFVSFCVLRSFVLLYVSYEHTSVYHTVKWIAYVPQAAILIAVVLEIFYLLFHPVESLPAKTVRHFTVSIGVVATLALVFSILHPGAQPTAWMKFLRSADQVVSWVLCSVFVFVALFSTYFGIPWRHRAYGIGLGFLVYLAVDVAVVTIVAQFGLPPFSLLWLFDMFAFLTACAIWVYYFSGKEVARSVPTYEQIAKVRAVVGDFGNLLKDFDLEGQRSRKR